MEHNYNETLGDIIDLEFDYNETLKKKILNSIDSDQNITLGNYKDNYKNYSNYPDVLQQKLSDIILDIEKTKKRSQEKLKEDVYKKMEGVKGEKNIKFEQENLIGEKKIWTKDDILKELNDEDKPNFKNAKVEDILNLTKDDWINIFGKVQGTIYSNRISKLTEDFEERITKKRRVSLFNGQNFSIRFFFLCRISV